jgi:AP endonuclease-1
MSRRSSRRSVPTSYAEQSENESEHDPHYNDENLAPVSKTRETPKKKTILKGTAVSESEVTATKSPRTRMIKEEDKSEVTVKASPKRKTGKGKVEQDIKVEVATRKRKSASEQVDRGVTDEVDDEVKRDTKVKATVRTKKQPNGETKVEVEPTSVQTTAARKRKVKHEDEAESNTQVIEEKETKKVTKKRKTKAELEAEMLPLAARTAVSTLGKKMYIGAHVSAAGGVHKAVHNAVHIGGNAFALFLKSQRKWANPPLPADCRDNFIADCKTQGYEAGKHVLPHGSYLVNLAQIEDDKAKQAYDSFLEDLQRCEALGIKLYNFHPGNHANQTREQAIARIAKQLNRAHAATESVITVLENMAGQGNVVGSTWEDLRDIIALVERKDRVGVCIDTCHAFAAGYDLRTPESFAKVMDGFNEVVGAQYLKALHINDSKAPLGSHRDLHANIGTGFLGLRAFWNVANYAGFEGLPMVLETPIERKGDDGKTIEDKGVWAKEIKLLESLIDMDPESEFFKSEEKRLWDEGAGERERIGGQVERRKQKTLDDMFKKAKGKGEKKGLKKGKKEGSGSGSELSEGEGSGCSH